MGRITQPDSVGSLLGDLVRRVDALERTAQPAAQVLTTGTFSPASHLVSVPNDGAWHQIATTPASLSFTLIRPTKVLLLGSLSAAIDSSSTGGPWTIEGLPFLDGNTMELSDAVFVESSTLDITFPLIALDTTLGAGSHTLTYALQRVLGGGPVAYIKSGLMVLLALGG